MKASLRELQENFRAFGEAHLKPFTAEWDAAAALPTPLFAQLAQAGFAGACISAQWGGKGWSQVANALLHEETGRHCSSTRSALTVHHNLVAETIQRWGTPLQKETYLPALAAGTLWAAFCLSEPETGSDAAAVITGYESKDGRYVLSGKKKWITLGTRADLFLVFASKGDKVSAFLVPRNTSGISITPIQGMLSIRASGMAEILFDNVEVPAENLLGREGLGITQIANTALDSGRMSVAAGALGLHEACLEAMTTHAQMRKQGGTAISQHQLIRSLIAEVTAEASASRLMVMQAARLRDLRDANAMMRTAATKYFASRAACRAADAAVQVLGACGLDAHHGSGVERLLRDARMLRIIEGTDQILQNLIGAEAAISTHSFIGNEEHLMGGEA